MAYGSWAGIYTHIKLKLMSERNRVLYFVLECLAIHADQFGLCYPGNQRLGEMAGYGESTIENAILELVSRQWIKVYETRVPYRRGRIERDIQISPEILYIRDELVDYAWSLWNGCPRNFDAEMEMLINYVQPESESSVSNHQKTTVKEPSSKTTTTTTTKKAAVKPQNSPIGQLAYELPDVTQEAPGDMFQREAPTHQREAQDEHNIPTHQTPNIPPPIPRTPPQDLREFHAPFSDQHCEDLAQRLRSEFGTRIAQARQLVASAGIDTVLVGIDYVYQERKNARIQNPFGLLKWWLSSHAIAPDDSPAAALAPDEYTPGKYDEFLQS